MHMPRDTGADTPDEILLALYARGDPDAARILMHRLLPRVLRYAGRILSDPTEAEDVAQDVMVRLWRMAPEWRSGEAQVSTWIYHVTTNLCTDRLRTRARKPVLPLEVAPQIADAAAGAVARLIETDRMSALQHALDQLPDRQRQAVVLRHIEGLSNPQIATVMDIGIEAVESLTARGKRALAMALMGQRTALGYEDEGA